MLTVVEMSQSLWLQFSVCLSVCLAYMKSSKRQKSASSDSDTNSSDSDSSDKQQTVNSEVSIIPTITRESLIVNTETDECFFSVNLYK